MPPGARTIKPLQQPNVIACGANRSRKRPAAGMQTEPANICGKRQVERPDLLLLPFRHAKHSDLPLLSGISTHSVKHRSISRETGRNRPGAVENLLSLAVGRH